MYRIYRSYSMNVDYRSFMLKKIKKKMLMGKFS